MIGPKLNRDWEGLSVRLLRPARNGYALLPAGTTGEIEGYSRCGIVFVSEKCECCGVQIRISRMRRGDFEILTPSEEWPDTRGQGRRRRYP